MKDEGVPEGPLRLCSVGLAITRTSRRDGQQRLSNHSPPAAPPPRLMAGMHEVYSTKDSNVVHGARQFDMEAGLCGPVRCWVGTTLLIETSPTHPNADRNNGGHSRDLENQLSRRTRYTDRSHPHAIIGAPESLIHEDDENGNPEKPNQSVQGLDPPKVSSQDEAANQITAEAADDFSSPTKPVHESERVITDVCARCHRIVGNNDAPQCANHCEGECGYKQKCDFTTQ